MSEEEWPIGTPRDEILARVVTRGNRIIAVRRAFSVAMVASVVGVSALGAGAVISNFGSKGVETEQIAFDPAQGRPSPADGSPTSGTVASTPGSTGTTETTLALGPGSTPVTGPTAPTAPASRGTTTVPRRRTTTSTTRPAPSTTPRPPVTTTLATTTTTTTVPRVKAPAVGTVRVKADGVSVGTNVCENEPATVASVAVDEATTVVLNLNYGDQTHTLVMTADGDEWSADLGAIGAKPDVPGPSVLVTVIATGPGGVTRTSAALGVVDCTP